MNEMTAAAEQDTSVAMVVLLSLLFVGFAVFLWRKRSNIKSAVGGGGWGGGGNVKPKLK